VIFARPAVVLPGWIVVADVVVVVVDVDVAVDVAAVVVVDVAVDVADQRCRSSSMNC
jgi:hypothetical protein